MSGIEGVTLYCADMDRNHLPVIAFNIEGMDAGQAGMFLDVEHDIITRTGLQCAPLVHEGIGTFDIDGTVRFSIGPFNTESHIQHAIHAVTDIAEYARKKAAP